MTDMYGPRWVSADQEPTELHSQILPRLFQGGTADSRWNSAPWGSGGPAGGCDTDTEAYDAVATLFAWAPPAEWGVEEIRFGFPDSAIRGAEVERIVRTARWAHERWTAGDRVLVRCQAGLNRSGLVMAMVLMLDGWTAEEAIRRIRERRAEVALVNDRFVDFLMNDAADALGLAATTSSMPSSSDPVAV
ncbi:protein-tyrosine phosphatase family protein [Demequina gelatinilytica]|uniref:protein-tyrosine phosphatase family protein n=1 Tax=Demequina gelatinilytica TaxID=1638980 RepID=UPI0007839DD0|nr:dual specificity protein phosphatase family protein [Demequina gelatinilytica]